mmetsp:Transcript_83346/g.269711  ORF Transcript_83346/g.269711 Transcript_83346/m.269711 type:complete len:305 (-) Transcript_83346:424-1338(-)
MRLRECAVQGEDLLVRRLLEVDAKVEVAHGQLHGQRIEHFDISLQAFRPNFGSDALDKLCRGWLEVHVDAESLQEHAQEGILTRQLAAHHRNRLLGRLHVSRDELLNRLVVVPRVCQKEAERYDVVARNHMQACDHCDAEPVPIELDAKHHLRFDGRGNARRVVQVHRDLHLHRIDQALGAHDFVHGDGVELLRKTGHTLQSKLLVQRNVRDRDGDEPKEVEPHIDDALHAPVIALCQNELLCRRGQVLQTLHLDLGRQAQAKLLKCWYVQFRHHQQPNLRLAGAHREPRPERGVPDLNIHRHK